GGVLLHPNWSALVSAGEPVSFFHMPVTLWSYSSSVLPIILTVLFMSFVERFAEKYSPNVVKAVLRPLLTLGITAPVALIVIGPLGSYLGRIFAIALSFLDTHLPVLVPTVVGAVFPLLVFVGMHLAIFPALQTVQLADMGYETVCGPGVLASNFAVAGATLAVAIKSRNAKTKELGFSTGVTALCGITEPALYGIIVKFHKPLIASVIGGAAGGVFAGISHLKRYALATPGIPALPTFMGEDPDNIFMALITLAIGFLVSFVVAWILGTEEDEPAKLKVYPASETVNEFYSPVAGELIPMEEITDPVFASGTVGKCTGVRPAEENVYAPFDGEITMVADTKHAIGLLGNNGLELLIHVGIDTTAMEGKGFYPLCQVGDKVCRGQKLMSFSLKEIHSAGYSDTVVIAITNSDDHPDVRMMKM
ncbi:MAG TPA: PTS beta-glucoside transporter subunit EIIBCA, partial [Lachnospiraceae bacterium]|nr:PTS beta-glucoside transporter subunit EIIBCA [Lachnospiraceae bacterium]